MVEFAQDNERRVIDALGDLRPRGDTTLVSAIVEATGDFNDPERFGPDVSKSIIVITGGDDTCHANPRRPSATGCARWPAPRTGSGSRFG